MGSYDLRRVAITTQQQKSLRKGSPTFFWRIKYRQSRLCAVGKGEKVR